MLEKFLAEPTHIFHLPKFCDLVSEDLLLLRWPQMLVDIGLEILNFLLGLFLRFLQLICDPLMPANTESESHELLVGFEIFLSDIHFEI